MCTLAWTTRGFRFYGFRFYGDGTIVGTASIPLPHPACRARGHSSSFFSRGVSSTSPHLLPLGRAHGFRELSRVLDDLAAVATFDRRWGQGAPCPHREGAHRKPVVDIFEGDAARRHERDVREGTAQSLQIGRPARGSWEKLHRLRAEPAGEHDL